MDEIVDGNAYYPIEVRTHKGEVKVFNTAEDVPEGVAFSILRTNVKPASKIINTGVPKVWGGGDA